MILIRRRTTQKVPAKVPARQANEEEKGEEVVDPSSQPKGNEQNQEQNSSVGNKVLTGVGASLAGGAVAGSVTCLANKVAKRGKYSNEEATMQVSREIHDNNENAEGEESRVQLKKKIPSRKIMRERKQLNELQIDLCLPITTKKQIQCY